MYIKSAKFLIGIISILILTMIFLAYIKYMMVTVNSLIHDTSGASQINVLLQIILRLTIFYFTFESIRMLIKTLSGAFFYTGQQSIDKNFQPSVSVIVPAWNEEVGIEKTINSVLASDYPNITIIVVNDGSTDNTREVAERLVLEHKGRIVLVNQSNSGKGEALNNGIRNSSGDIIINIDADSYIHSDAVSNLVSRFENPDVEAVVGTVVVGNRKSWIGKMQFFEYLFGFHLRRTQSVFNSIFILSGAMCAYRRTAYNQLEGFRDYSRTEDMDFTLHDEAEKLSDCICR